ncbi:MAG TPA: LytTR family DNA-binding domain-containing protein [Xanthomonadales bacterium]|nr:LytTR family DNA-binding domain-containing protein [Xanthomonadales bacterium]
MLNILIIDDEKPARDRLRRMLSNIPGCQVCGEAGDGISAFEEIQALGPDVLLLDISMPGIDGMTLAERLRNSNEVNPVPAIIFCTAFEDQALRALDNQALDYLVKPVRSARLEQAVDKARHFLLGARQKEETDFLRSTVGGKVSLIPVRGVICLLSEDKYTTVVYEEGHTVIDDSLTELERRYDSYFLRVHRNALISKHHVRGLERTADGQALAILAGTDRRPIVSRRNLSALRTLLNEF